MPEPVVDLTSARPLLLVQAPGSGQDVSTRLGQKDYSYYFAMRPFLTVLEQLGEVRLVRDAREAERQHVQAGDRPTVQFLFSPPHDYPLDTTCPTLPVFAWEFDTIPVEQWSDEPRHDWRVGLRAAGAAITHSQFAADATRQAMGDNYPVWSIPAPIHERSLPLRTDVPPAERRCRLDFEGVAADSRALGLDRSADVPAPDVTPGKRTLELEGVLYTTVLNPDDGRKNWADILTAFLDAFSATRSVTLVVKLVHTDPNQLLSLWDILRRMAPFDCRVVLLHAYLDDEGYGDLIRATAYAVNASRGEGQCLPLMEFMSAGCPAVAPDHTAMTEYVKPDNSFPIRTYSQWTSWPHDPRGLLRAHWNPTEWDSLRDSYLASRSEAATDPAAYAQRSARAVEALHDYCSQDTARVGLQRVLTHLARTTWKLSNA